MDDALKNKILEWLNYQETVRYIECDDFESDWYMQEKIQYILIFLKDIGYCLHHEYVNIHGDYVKQYTGISEVQNECDSKSIN